jgi:hypothetical protein
MSSGIASTTNISEVPAVAGLVDQLQDKSTVTSKKNSVTFSNMSLSEEEFLNLRIYVKNEWSNFYIKNLQIYKVNTDTNTKIPVSSYDLTILQRIINFKIKEYINKNKLKKFEGEKNFSFTLKDALIKLSDLDFISGLLVNEINAPNISLKSIEPSYSVNGVTIQPPLDDNSCFTVNTNCSNYYICSGHYCYRLSNSSCKVCPPK